jgi:hypothetical protein
MLIVVKLQIKEYVLQEEDGNVKLVKKIIRY